MGPCRDALFRAHRASRGKRGGYTVGEKIAIKANINGSAVDDDDTSGKTKMSCTDPVAIDSVGADFLMNEPAVTSRNGALWDNPTVENYLHEAGLVGEAPSGTGYTDIQGRTVTNLGIHEHWTNYTDKQYSRNLGKAEGIELVNIRES